MSRILVIDSLSNCDHFLMAAVIQGPKVSELSPEDVSDLLGNRVLVVLGEAVESGPSRVTVFINPAAVASSAKFKAAKHDQSWLEEQLTGLGFTRSHERMNCWERLEATPEDEFAFASLAHGVEIEIEDIGDDGLLEALKSIIGGSKSNEAPPKSHRRRGDKGDVLH